jgi:hypothetical protein
MVGPWQAGVELEPARKAHAGHHPLEDMTSRVRLLGVWDDSSSV